jgi:pyruvate formate lyase activating enzyme
LKKMELCVREAMLQIPINSKVQCLVCERRCLLVEGGKGWCRTRTNYEGKIYTLIYGAVSSLSANPIEKKPLYHFYPGSRALTAGSWSCNFGCPWCQNWDISKTAPPPQRQIMSPDDFILETLRQGCQGTSISFNEPTLSLEWSLDVFGMAREKGLYNTFVTNGYMTEEALALLSEAGLNAMNLDVKGESATVRKHCKGIDIEKVWARCQQALELDLHLEITTLVIPSVNDGDDCLSNIASRIANELGAEIPWHVSGYFPAYQFTAPPTSINTLERAYDIGRGAGLQYVYIGNMPGHPGDNTHCPNCGETIILRQGFSVLEYHLLYGLCKYCETPIPGVWWSEKPEGGLVSAPLGIPDQ